MRFLIAGLSIVLISVEANPAVGQPAATKPKQYVGEVIIVGNTITQDRVIRAALADLNPGQPLVFSDLQKAEKKLVRLGLFKVDPAKKIGPTVSVLESDGEFKDILVKVEESNTRRMRCEAAVDGAGGPVFRVIMEDRNFDPFRLPTCVDDILEGNAFRGGGQKVRLSLFQVSILDARIVFFPQGLIIPTLIRPLVEE